MPPAKPKTLTFVRADASLAKDLRAIALACADDLTKRFGKGHWSGVTTIETVRRNCKRREVWVAKDGGRPVATFTLEPKKPNFISKRHFTPPVDPALWLVTFYVHPGCQGRGIGRACLEEMRRLARDRGAKWVRWDAYSAPAGASAFYEKCGARKIDETVLRGVGLAIFELAAG